MKRNVILSLLFIVGSIFLYFWVIPYFTQPVGVPLDFYEISESLDKSNMEIYYIGNDIPLNERVSYNDVYDINDIPLINVSNAAIIIEFNENDNYTEEAYNRIIKLYKEYCYKIILIGYNSTYLKDIIDPDDSNGDIIFLDYSSCQGPYFSKATNTPRDITRENIQYIITTFLVNEIED
ncbi:MAG: hypothetical protein K9L64_07060 [Candidatus Izimaplasma sp.]|nr:hypothetical protein [Candidatus Izimaplasma bacterium]